MNPHQITQKLINDVILLAFAPPVTHVYCPLEYAERSYRRYLEKYGQGRREILLVGMNPGPWGMTQTGIPFGDVVMVRDWLGIRESVEHPAVEHPKRPILGFDCPRREVSGARLWSWAKDAFETPECFFTRFFVYNYCPLCFLEESGRNRTPDKLPASEREPLYAVCDEALRRTVEFFQPRLIIGVGAFAEKRAQEALGAAAPAIGKIPHPSPANPSANRGWAQAVAAVLKAYGL
ncbi:MAG: uracil-DNA glycosylase family protein [Candidatus Omnitrophota bacterium]